MPTNSDYKLICLPRSSINNTYSMLIEKTCRANSFDKLDTSTVDILSHVFFLVGILRNPFGIG